MRKKNIKKCGFLFSLRLANGENSGFYDAATDGCTAGPYTQSKGFWGYNELCERLYIDGELHKWNKHRVKIIDPKENAFSPPSWRKFHIVLFLLKK